MVLFSGEQMRLGRVLHDDDSFITIEIAKDLDHQLEVRDGDRFVSLVFIRRVASEPADALSASVIEVYLPWEDA